MYESFYNLREKPFTLLPDPGFLYLSDKHRMVASLFEYSLANQAGFTVISGEIGAGKTTLIRHMLNQMERDHTVGLISTTHRTFGELLQWILLAFNLEHANMGKVEMYQRFIDFIIDEYAHNRRVILIVDEAQNMTAEVLEELRMLSNINADKDQALQVILVGQRELRETLQRPELAQFAQRISVDFHLQPLSEDETVAYIRHRLQVAGGDPDIFDEAASRAIYRYSNGVPRLINVLCDTALVYGYAEQSARIDARLVTAVAYEKQQGGIFPIFEPAVIETGPADVAAGSAAAFSEAPNAQAGEQTEFSEAAHPEPPEAQTEERTDFHETDYSEVTGAQKSEQTDFPDKVPESELITAEEHDPPEDAASSDTSLATDTIHAHLPGSGSHSHADPEPALAQPLMEDGVRRKEDTQLKKKVSVALCSAHDGFRVYLTKLLVNLGIDVVVSAPLYEENLAVMDPDEFDVLLIDRDEYATAPSPELGNILAGWRGPLLYNDTQAMKTALRQGNYAFGKDLAAQITALANVSAAKTGT